MVSIQFYKTIACSLSYLANDSITRKFIPLTNQYSVYTSGITYNTPAKTNIDDGVKKKKSKGG